MNVQDIAKIAHEINAAYCFALGDLSQQPWEEAPQWQRESAVLGVQFHLDNPDASASSSHDSWRKEKHNSGWVYGEEKDAELKTHPCMVDFDLLPKDQQAKDFIFSQVVRSLKKYYLFHLPQDRPG